LISPKGAASQKSPKNLDFLVQAGDGEPVEPAAAQALI
jgi:hypothetical protein